MSDFDIDAYFSTKLNNVDIGGKLNSLKAASQAKVATLRAEAETARQEAAANKAAYDQSWAGQLGLDSGGFVANRVNDAASLASGAGRLAGQVASLPVSAKGILDTNVATDEDYAAYNRLKSGTATEEDRARLNRDVGELKGQPILERFESADKLRGAARAVNDFFDISSVVDPTNRRGLEKSLGKDFQKQWDKVTAGWDAGKRGDFLKGSSDLVSGLAGLISNAGAAALDNPSAVREYVLENAPQLFVGAAGKAGQAAMASSNVGYAVDYYQQGLENYQKNNQGRLPSADDRREMALWAASLAAAEQVGDTVGLAATKLGRKASVDQAKASILASLGNVAKAGSEGLLTEAATEGYQTYAEGKVLGDPTVSAKDVYTGAVIGGLSGGALSGGGRALAEVTQATPEQVQQREQETRDAVDFQAAVQQNDPSAYLNPGSKQYEPATGLGVLFTVNQKEDTTPEQRQENLSKAFEVVTNLDEQGAKLAEQLKTAPKSEQDKIKTQLSAINRQLKDAETVLEQMADHHVAAPSKETVKALVQEANAGTEEQSSVAAERVINLSMQNVDHLSFKEADSLASNPDNALSTEQRDYLRAFSEARQTENVLSSMAKVSQEILFGSKKNEGITQYRSKISTAIAVGDQAAAEKRLGMLADFAADHADKAKVAAAGMVKGLGTQIVKVEGRGWQIADRPYTQKEMVANGGLTLNSGRLVRDIQTEAKALANTQAEMEQAIRLRFGGQGVQSAPSTPTPSPSQRVEDQDKNKLSLLVEEDLARPSVPDEPPVAPQPQAPTPPARATLASRKEQQDKLDAELATINAKKASKPVTDLPAVNKGSTVLPSGNTSSEASSVDTGEDIPLAFQAKINVPQDIWIDSDGEFASIERPADQVLEDLRKEIAGMEQLLACMKGG